MTRCEFQISAMSARDFPRGGLPEIAFMGRSNVGKSSLINCLLGIGGMARTSKTPGRTRAVNFFLVNDRSYFVDLPGYGFARVPDTVRRSWKELVEAYLTHRQNLALAIQIIDARMPPTELDMDLNAWLRSLSVPYCIALTKMDKLSSSRGARALSELATGLGLKSGEGVVGVSAKSGGGIPMLWKLIDEACRANGTGPLTAPPFLNGGLSDINHKAVCRQHGPAKNQR